MKNEWRYENEFRTNFRVIAGVDEVGRSPIAGPVLSAAIILPTDFSVQGIDDSKALTLTKREELFPLIINNCIDYGIGVVSHKLIDKINIFHSSLLSMKFAVENLKIKPDIVLVDGPFKIPSLNIIQKPIVHGDSLSISIAAASIVAKVVRDRLMNGYHQDYPYYSFNTNKGYWSKKQYDGIKKYGLCELHRKTFKYTRNFYS